MTKTILSKLSKHKYHPLAIASLLAALLLNTAFVWYLDTQRSQRQSMATAQTSQAFLNQLQLRLERNFTAAYAIAAGINQAGAEQIEFSAYARELLNYYPDIVAVSLAPNGVINDVYPLAGNEQLLGFDMFAHPAQSIEAKRAKAAGKLRLNGPFALVQGGSGVVARLPLYQQTNKGGFQGFINVTLLLDPMLDGLHQEYFSESSFAYKLWRYDAEQQTQIIRQHANPAANSLSFTLPLADNPWQLDMHYQPSWQEQLTFWLEVLFALFSSLLLYSFALFYLQLRSQRGLLEHQVVKRTDELQQTLQRYRSFIQASNTGGWEYDHSRNFLKCSQEYFSMLGRRREHYDQSGQDNLAATWLDLMHPDDVTAASQAFIDYLQQPDGMYESQFRMRHQDGHWVWVLSRGRAMLNEDGSLSPIVVGTHIDISSQKQAEMRLRLLEQLFEQSSEGMLVTDPNHTIVLVNRAFTAISGYSSDEVMGQTPKLLSSGKHNKDFYQAMQQAIQRHGSWQGEIWNRRKNGELYPEWLSISQIRDAKGQLSHYVALFSDISTYKQDQEKLNLLAHFDTLTQLPNRTLLIDRTEQAIQRAKRAGQQIAMLFIDLDRFKKINDALGHDIGDEVLVQAAKRLQAMTRSQDTLSRLSSDEFILLLPDTNQEAAGRLAKRILETMQTPYQFAKEPLSISASIGIAIFPNDGANFFELNKHADIAMFKAKEDGRNKYCFFTAGMQSQFNRQLQLENALRLAITNNQLQLAYQPQLCLEKNTLTGFEALLRWQHPELGFISPAEFIPVAEHSGLMIKLGEWVLQHAIQQQKRWYQHGYTELVMAINLSPVQFRQPELLDIISTQLELAKLPAHCIELEITESAMVEDAEQAIKTVDAIRHKGISLAIDDFGTGYSSLSYLKRFHLSKLKIDQSFVRELLDSPEDRAIVTAIIRMAQSLGLRTIAEGVETAEHQSLLQQLGCDDIQGYHYGRPMPAEAATAFIQQAFVHQQA
ncbi:EAL domain-containing protein [Alkalimonas sp. MEB108]|uniref:EAL domain-containing protein n=1 Tax=Alkalimonas cellulosilytica TaxID=3058395 RepID=A0ABU7J5N2_9GAMM|nr:EAL domain-containing protein [Alkalimonas sp. MEB108]MEE2001752.1 EAL domain-containing protein [Alkalimonas sp. MEB108]